MLEEDQRPDLAVLDDLERALTAFEQSDPETIADGVALVHRALWTLLEREGVAEGVAPRTEGIDERAVEIEEEGAVGAVGRHGRMPLELRPRAEPRVYRVSTPAAPGCGSPLQRGSSYMGLLLTVTGCGRSETNEIVSRCVVYET